MKQKIISGTLLFSVIGVILIAIGFVVFLGFLFKETTGYNPLYLLLFLAICALFGAGPKLFKRG